jgi:hypothetical protein
VSDERAGRIYMLLVGEDDGRVCRDIPEEACHEQPGNFLRHVLSLSATKTGDGLADPKLVLSWLLGTLGAPALYIGLLVPVREAGALLPQLGIAGAIRALPQRKWVWSAGSVVQGIAVAGMALAATSLNGAVAGATIVALLAVFALGRSVCSVSYKDVLGKTVSKTTRGTTTGTAATIASTLVLSFGVLLSLGIIPRTAPAIAAALLVAAVLWFFAALTFATLFEVPGATEGGGNPLRVAIDEIGLLRRDPQLVRFIVTRGLLIATALAPPYLLALAGESNGRQLGELGPFVVASALAAVTSTYFWGRLSDRSSRKVLIIAALVGAASLGGAALLGVAARNGWLPAGPTGAGTAFPLVLYVMMIAYQGVRLGRATHIVDMADEDTRAAYTALSNTIIGVLLVGGGIFGALAARFGEGVVLVCFALMCVAAAVAARGLEEVQQ